MNAPFLRSLLAGAAGFVGYGGWAFFANLSHGSEIAARAGWVQGTYSLVLTFVMTFVTEWLFARTKELAHGMAVTVLIVCIILFSSAYGIHMVAGTPEILMTILPGFIIGTIYTAVYVWGLQKAQSRRFELDTAA